MFLIWSKTTHEPKIDPTVIDPTLIDPTVLDHIDQGHPRFSLVRSRKILRSPLGLSHTNQRIDQGDRPNGPHGPTDPTDSIAPTQPARTWSAKRRVAELARHHTTTLAKASARCMEWLLRSRPTPPIATSGTSAARQNATTTRGDHGHRVRAQSTFVCLLHGL